MVEAEAVRLLLERLELVGVPVADDREVPLAGTEVLADGEDLDVVLAQLSESVVNLLEAVAETDV